MFTTAFAVEIEKEIMLFMNNKAKSELGNLFNFEGNKVYLIRIFEQFNI